MFTKNEVKYFLLVLAVMICARGAYGQTCSTASPCVPVLVTGTVGSPTTLLKCGGTCTAASLTTYLASPTSTSPWSVVGTFAQKAVTVTYNDPEPYSSQISYAAYDTPSGGAASPVSGIITFQMPAPPQTAPSLIAGPNLATTGPSGVQ